MFTKRVIPCLDVNEGRVVKGVNFVNLIDAGDPVSVGAAYGKAGADELVFLDITASSDAREIKANMVRKVAETVFIPFTVVPDILAKIENGEAISLAIRFADSDADGASLIQISNVDAPVELNKYIPKRMPKIKFIAGGEQS